MWDSRKNLPAVVGGRGGVLVVDLGFIEEGFTFKNFDAMKLTTRMLEQHPDVLLTVEGSGNRGLSAAC